MSMNESVLIIEGFTLWVFLILLLAAFLGFVIMGAAYIAALRANDELNGKFKKLRANYNILIGMYQRDTFKLPEVEDNG